MSWNKYNLKAFTVSSPNFVDVYFCITAMRKNPSSCCLLPILVIHPWQGENTFFFAHFFALIMNDYSLHQLKELCSCCHFLCLSIVMKLPVESQGARRANSHCQSRRWSHWGSVNIQFLHYWCSLLCRSRKSSGWRQTWLRSRRTTGCTTPAEQITFTISVQQQRKIHDAS